MIKLTSYNSSKSWIMSALFGGLVVGNIFQKRLLNSRITTRPSNAIEAGHVYFVATPLGNLGDISQRAIDILTNVDIICAEDTRHTLNLLRSFSIKDKTLVSHHEHNWAEQIPKFLKLISEGKSLAIVSDAGTPCISDPGYQFAAECHKNKIPIHPIPGPSAVIAALSISGFPGSDFTFKGFLPMKGKERQQLLQEIASATNTIIFFEAPHRVLQTLTEFEEKYQQGSRECICCREITKIHEEFHRDTLSANIQWLKAMAGKIEDDDTEIQIHRNANKNDNVRIRGEFTIIFGPVEKGSTLADAADIDSLINNKLIQLHQDGIKRSEAVKLVVDILNVPKTKVYKLALEMFWD